jgi:hypothetical protein
MNTIDPTQVQWDVALEALLTERYHSQGQPLDLAVLRNLAEFHTIRLDDILDTLCKLASHGLWAYTNSAGQNVEPDSDMCRLLKANHRLNDTQLERLGGLWQPLD